MTIHRLILILAGAGAVAAIGYAAIQRGVAAVSPPLLIAMLLGTYAAGLGLGGIVVGRTTKGG